MKYSDNKMINDRTLAYFLARTTMGVNFFVHGFIRLPKLEEFRVWMVSYFQDSLLNDTLVALWATMLPFLELTIGSLLLLGLFTRKAILSGAFVLLILLLGACLKENWEWVGIQMVYALYFFILMIYVKYNNLSIDYKIFKR